MKVKHFFQRAVALLLAVIMLLPSTISGLVPVQAGQMSVSYLDNYVKGVVNYDDGLKEYLSDRGGDLDNALMTAFPEVFKHATNLDTGEQSLISFRFPIFDAKTLDGVRADVAWTYARPSSVMLFSKDGQPTYCLDYSTPAAGSRKDYFLDDLADSLDVDKTKGVIAMAEALTKDNFKYMKDNAEAIAKGFSNQYLTIAKKDVVALLKSDSDVAKAFKQMVVQWLVWSEMNDLSLTQTPAVEWRAATGPQGVDKDGNPIVSAGTLYDTLVGPPEILGIGVLKEAGKDKKPTNIKISTSGPSLSAQITYTIFQEDFAGIKIEKKDKDSVNEPQAPLTGIRFAIINDTGDSVKDGNEQTYANGEVVYVLTTDENGDAKTPNEVWLQTSMSPDSKYIVKELRQDDQIVNNKIVAGTSKMANDYYEWDADNEQSIILSEKETYHEAESPFYNKVKPGKGTIIKKDAALAENASQGDASLAGIKYAIVHNSKKGDNDEYPKAVDGTTYHLGQVVKVVTLDENGKTDVELPLGGYTVHELSANSTAKAGDTWTDALTGTSELANESYLYVKQSKSLVLTPAESEKEVEFTNPVVPGNGQVIKVDADNETAQGDASLKDIEFAIVNRSAKQVSVGGAVYPAGSVVMIVKTNEKGEAASGNSLPYGTYDVIELSLNHTVTKGATYNASQNGKSIYSNNNGYLYKAQTKRIVIRTKDKTETAEFENNVATGGAKLIKVDALTTTKQGDADFANIEYAIVNRSAKEVVVGDKTYKKNDVVKIVKVNAEGIITTGDDLLPYGTYDIIELSLDHEVKEGSAYNTNQNGKSEYANSTGYLYSAQTQKIVVRENGKIYEANFKDEVVRGGVKLAKWSWETNRRDPQGSATLEGAVFRITNKSKAKVVVDGKEYAPGEYWEVETDKQGLYESINTWLPYGTYHVDEITPPEGYLHKGVLSCDFVIRENKVIVDKDNDEGAIKNEIKRGDVEFVKVDEKNMKRLANIPFIIESVTTGERHIIVTDINGEASTHEDFNSHTQKTNANDAAYVDGVLDESKLDNKAGVFFTGEAIEDIVIEPREGVGALPYDTYKLIELRCKNNEGYELIGVDKEVTFTIERDGRTVHLGTIDDHVEPVIELYTTAKNANAESEAKAHHSAAQKDNAIIDTIEYYGLDPRTEYQVVTKIWDKTDDAFVKDADGNEVSVTTPVTSRGEDGEFKVEIPYDGSKLLGHSLVVFEYLYKKDADPEKDKPIATHEDPDDEDQTVDLDDVPPTIKLTKVVDERFTEADAESTFTVTVENLGSEDLKDVTVDDPLVTQINPDGTTAEIKNGKFTKVIDNTHAKATAKIENLPDGNKNQRVSIERLNIGEYVVLQYSFNVPKDAVSGTKFDNTAYTHGKGVFSGKPVEDDDIDYPYIPNKEVHPSIDVTKVVREHLVNQGTEGVFDIVVTNNGTEDLDNVVLRDTMKYGKQEGYFVKGTENNEKAPSATKITVENTIVKINSLNVGESVSIEYRYKVSENAVGDSLYENIVTAEGDGRESGEHVTDSDDDYIFTPESDEEEPQIKVKKTVDDHEKTPGEIATFTITVSNNGVEDLKDVTLDDVCVYGTSEGKFLANTVNATKAPSATEIKVQDTHVDINSLNVGESVTILYEFKVPDVKDETHYPITRYDNKVTTTGIGKQSGKEVNDDDTDWVRTPEKTLTPEIATVLKDSKTNSHYVLAGADTKLMDTVKYKGLVSGKYILKATLVDQTSGKSVKVGGKEIVGTKEFNVTEPDGEVVVEYNSFDTTEIAGRAVVAFEELYKVSKTTKDDGTTETVEKPVAEHKDLTDESQTVCIPKIATIATDHASGKKDMTVGKDAQIDDKVTFSGLKKDAKYKLEGTVYDATARKMVDGATNTKTFTATSENGYVILPIKVDTTSLKGHKLVVFETLYDENDTVIAKHADKNDADQTVNVPNPPQATTTPTPTATPKPGTPTTTTTGTPRLVAKTGDNAPAMLLVALFAVAAVICGFAVKKRKGSSK